MNNDQTSDSMRTVSGGGIRSGVSRRATQPTLGTPSHPTIAEDLVRTARRRWPIGVAIITSDVPEKFGGGFRGFTISAFSFVSLNPPIVLVCIEQGVEMLDIIHETNHFAVSILDRDQQVFADLFAGLGPRPSREFHGIPHELLSSGCPVLKDAPAWLDCTIDQIIETGDHATIFATIDLIELGPDHDDPLISYDGTYRRIEGS